jgi:hypothetical protein
MAHVDVMDRREMLCLRRASIADLILATNPHEKG